MSEGYLQAMAALGPVGVAVGEVSAVTPCALGYCARVGIYIATGPTPGEAARALLREMAGICRLYSSNPVLYEDMRERRRRLIDALSESFEALGGDWRAV